MRKGVSILFVLAMMLSATRLTIAIHYCSGEVAATKVSLSGKLASCGMESTEKNLPVPGNNLTTHCCDNQITTIGIINNFTIPISLPEDKIQNVRKAFYVPVSQLFHSITTTSTLYTSSDPPGKFLTSTVSLPDICVFRI